MTRFMLEKVYERIQPFLCSYTIAVDVMMARTKRIYILIMKVNKLFSFAFFRRGVF